MSIENKIIYTPEQLEEARKILEQEIRTSTAHASLATVEPVSDNKPIEAHLPLVPPAPTAAITEANVKAEDSKVTLSSDDFELLQQLKLEQRQWQIDRKIKELGSEYTPRRNTLVLRRALKLYPELVSKEDVLAYSEIFKMREAITEKSKKVIVPEEEIEAYHQLEATGTPITLAAIVAIIKAKAEATK